jgi:predicted nucleic acid-binding protein
VILADTSAWVDFLRGTPRGRTLRDALHRPTRVACTEPVLMEVLAGARTSEEFAELRATLTGVGWLPLDPAGDFEAAARIYAMCRAEGITPRGLTDCLIAAVALRCDVAVLTSDADFERLAEVVPLRVLQA